MDVLETIKDSIDAMKMALADDFSHRATFEQSARERMRKFQEVDDEDFRQASKLLKQFLLDCEKHAQKLDKLSVKENLYEDALKKAKQSHEVEFCLRKLAEIEKEKRTFT